MMKWLLSLWASVRGTPTPAEPDWPEQEPNVEPELAPPPEPVAQDIGIAIRLSREVPFRTVLANSIYTELFQTGDVVWFYPNFVICDEAALDWFYVTVRTTQDWDALVTAAESAQQSAGSILAIERREPQYSDPAFSSGKDPVPLVDAPPAPVPEVAALPTPEPTLPDSATAVMPVPEPAERNDMAAHSIRVDLDRLDSLSNLIGELAVEKAQFAGLVERLELMSEGPARQVAHNLKRSMSKLTTVINALHEQSTELRMVPVGTLFGRFSRLVRDLSASTKKSLYLQRVGEETMLDKTIVEEMVDPLLHLVRNAADHGIEPPAERLQQGKRPVGTITLRAYGQGDQVVIEVEDDGRGIDGAKIKAKALEKGLITAEAADSLTQDDLVRLILLPGFSTAAAVTDISGRGVGMDVVKVNVERLRGTLDVTSEPAKGTRVTIRLPLTVSILQVMLAEAAGQIVAVPLNGLRGLTTITADDLQLWGQVMKYQNRLVPLVDLGISWWRGTACDTGYVMIMEAGAQEIALKITRPLGQSEVVIKPLGDYVGRVPGVAGAAILSDGRIALILDGTTLVPDHPFQGGSDAL